MAIIPRHHGANHLITRQSNKEKLVTHSDLLIDDEGRLIVRRLVTKNRLPKCDDVFAVSGLRKRSYDDFVHVLKSHVRSQLSTRPRRMCESTTNAELKARTTGGSGDWPGVMARLQITLNAPIHKMQMPQ